MFTSLRCLASRERPTLTTKQLTPQIGVTVRNVYQCAVSPMIAEKTAYEASVAVTVEARTISGSFATTERQQITLTMETPTITVMVNDHVIDG
jgi:hypothetical protein